METQTTAPRRSVPILVLTAIALFLSIATSGAQSLSDVAKKEKERRDKLGTKKTKVITDRELQGSYGGLPATSSTTATSGEASASGSAASSGEEPAGDASGDSASGDEDAAAEDSKSREYWQNRVQTVKDKIQKLDEELNSPEVSWGEGYRTDVNPLGNRNLTRRAELEKQLNDAKQELQQIRIEARRAGVPAGWVR